MSGSVSEWAVEVTSFNFSYGSFGGGTSNVSDASVILRDATLRLPWGSRALVVGLNGSGKSTLLKNIAGKHFHDHEKIKVAGQPAFFSPDTQSVVSLIGSEWRQDFSKSDIGAFRLIEGAIGYRADKAKELIDMFQVQDRKLKDMSSGQRQAVYLSMALLKPARIYLIDEATIELDLIVRRRFLDYMRSLKDVCVLMATHIFDHFLNDWPTHLVHLNWEGRVSVDEMSVIKPQFFAVIEQWLEEDWIKKQERTKNAAKEETKTLEQVLGENMRSDKHYNYWG